MHGPHASSRFAKYAIVGILMLGAFLRLRGIGAGLPFQVNVDEPQVMDRAFEMVRTGSFDPRGFYDYPTLSMYVQAAVISARFLAGAQAREWHALKDVWSGPFFLWCRIVTALIGTLTILVVYRAAVRWGTAAAIVAALLFAVQPQLTFNAHYVLTDTPMTFFVAVTMFLAIVASESRTWPWFAAAGAAAGLAAATKYNGAAAIVMPLAALVAVPAGSAIRRRAAAAAAVVVGAGAAFLVAAPYTVLNLPAFLNGFGDLLSKYPAPAHGKYELYLGHIRTAFVWPGSRSYVAAAPALLLLGAGALTIAVQLRPRATRAAALPLLVFPAAYFWFVSNQGGPSLTFDRYQLALWPALAIWFGVGVVVMRDLLTGPRGSVRARRAVLAILLTVLVVPAWHAYAQDDAIGISTAQQAGEWIVAHVRPAERIVVESDWIHLPPSYGQPNANGLTQQPLEVYQKQGVEYFVVCSCETDKYLLRPEDHAAEAAAYARLFEATSPVARFPGAMTFTILRMR